MDCDLQDVPEEIPHLYKKALEGFDIVFARRVNRQDSFYKKMLSKIFYKAFSYLSGIQQDGSIANFGIYNYKAIQAVNSMKEPLRAFSPMMRWIGFNKTAINVTHAERYEGKTSYNWNKLLNLGMDIAIAYSDKPLKLIIKLGMFISIISVLFSIYNLIAYFSGKITVPGYASIIISIWFLSGLVIFVIGVIGLYISRIFEAAKNRPIYIQDKLVNFN
jgi:dolichol-phosphate mannosyltransferase